MNSLTRTHRFSLDATPERIFPLLCPVREYEWIPGWRCEMLHSHSGAAEPDCVFRTNQPDTGPMTWVVTRYEPHARIEFTCFAVSGLVMRLSILLAPVNGSTSLEWTRRWLATTPAADAWIAGFSDASFASMMAGLEAALAHFLHTGRMIHA